MTSSWDPTSVLPSEQAPPASSAWDSLTSMSAPPVPGPPPPPAAPSDAEQWEFVDPSAYSNPYTETPVYTSGPLPPAPPPVQEPPVTPPPPPQAGADSWLTPPPAATGSDGAPLDPTLAVNYEPQRGELKIKERRTWKTWQLATAVVIAVVVGMAINGNSGSASGINGGGSSSGAGYKLPPAASSTPTTAAAGASAASPTTTAAGAATTTTAAGDTTTTVAGAGATATTAPVAVGPATVLVPTTQQTGNWTSPAFTIAGGTWNIGWAFQCAPAPTGGPSFQIFAVTNGSAASGTPAVTSTAASGQAVTPLTSTGSQQVMVQTTAACRWAVKVTGSSS